MADYNPPYELSICVDVARPIFGKNTGAHVAVKRRMRPIARPWHPRMLQNQHPPGTNARRQFGIHACWEYYAAGLHVRYDAEWHQWRITIRPTSCRFPSCRVGKAKRAHPLASCNYRGGHGARAPLPTLRIDRFRPQRGGDRIQAVVGWT